MSYMLLVIGGGGPLTVLQNATIAGSDLVTWAILILIIGIIWYLMQCINVNGYTCKECGYWTPDRQDAAGDELDNHPCRMISWAHLGALRNLASSLIARFHRSPTGIEIIFAKQWGVSRLSHTPRKKHFVRSIA